MTPILRCRRLGHRFGLENLYIKDESRLPTGSFKSRGLAMAITMAGQFGLRRVAIPTAGNAGGALAAYAARSGIEAFVFMPEDTPVINQLECRLAGAKTFLVNGLITDCGRIVREGKEHLGWFDMSTLKEPYRIEGKKTMGLELAEQFGWRLPDVIVYPTGGGTGLIGMWKAFEELAELGWLEDAAARAWWPCNRRAVRRSCGAFEAGERFAEPFADAATVASGIRVPAAVGDFMILDAVRASDGRAVAVDEARLRYWMALGTSTEGISICPETAACLGAVEKLAAEAGSNATSAWWCSIPARCRNIPRRWPSSCRGINKDAPLDWERIGGVSRTARFHAMRELRRPRTAQPDRADSRARRRAFAVLGATIGGANGHGHGKGHHDHHAQDDAAPGVRAFPT